MGQAKLAIYKSGKEQGQEDPVSRPTAMFKGLVKARIKVDFWFHSFMNIMDEFVSKWCFTKAMCSVVGGQLSFNSVLV